MLKDLKENWYQQLLREFRSLLKQLHHIQYKNRYTKIQKTFPEKN